MQHTKLAKSTVQPYNWKFRPSLVEACALKPVQKTWGSVYTDGTVHFVGFAVKQLI